jgi:hypothetical protein
MAMRYQQDLQVTIRERLRRLLVAEAEDAVHEIRLVTDWIDKQPALRAILAEAARVEPGLNPAALVSVFTNGQTGLNRGFRWPSSTEDGRASIIWQFMRHIAAQDSDEVASADMMYDYGQVVSYSSGPDDVWRDLAARILRPLFDYLSERVGEESSVLYVLERYVHLVEWFDRKDLHARAMQDSRKAEEVYDAHLRRFLFGEGINMPFSQAKSASGESDVLTDLDTSDPLVCEIKIFDADNRGKRHLASGVHQAISYASDYGKQVAYLVIIKLSGRPLTLPSDDDTKLWPPRITIAGTLVYLIAARALPPVASASKLGKPAPVIITRDDLVDPDAADEST